MFCVRAVDADQGTAPYSPSNASTTGGSTSNVAASAPRMAAQTSTPKLAMEAQAEPESARKPSARATDVTTTAPGDQQRVSTAIGFHQSILGQQCRMLVPQQRRHAVARLHAWQPGSQPQGHGGEQQQRRARRAQRESGQLYTGAQSRQGLAGDSQVMPG